MCAAWLNRLHILVAGCVVRKVHGVIDMCRPFGVLDRPRKRDAQVSGVRAPALNDGLGIETGRSGGRNDSKFTHAAGIDA
jgi:hypothetical protein